MCALNTNGFALSALPRAPDIPSNIGKIDVKAIYDAVQHGLSVADAVRLGAPRESLERAQDQLGTQTAIAGQQRLPFATQADIAQNQASASQNAPDLIGARHALASTQIGADTTGQQNRQTVLSTVGSMSPIAQTALAETGKLPTSETSGVGRDANGNIVVKRDSSVAIGDTSVPTNTSTSTGPGGPQITPLPTGANGVSPGWVVTTVGPDGQLQSHVAPAPQAMFKATLSSPVRFAGSPVDPATGQIPNDEYEVIRRTALGDEPTSIILKVPHGSPPPGELISPRGTAAPAGGTAAPAGGTAAPAGGAAAPAGGAAAPAPFVGRIGFELAAKNKQEALNDLASSAESTNALKANIDHAAQAIQQYNQDSVLPNYVRSKLPFLPSVQAVNAAKSQFVSDIMGKLRGAGRVTQQEVQYASSAYPSAEQAQPVQESNIAYLRELSDVVSNRRVYEYNAIKEGLLPSDAKMAAIQKYPILPPPVAGTARSVGASGAAPSSTPAQSPTITSKEQYDALGEHAAYVDAAGNPHFKNGPP